MNYKVQAKPEGRGGCAFYEWEEDKSTLPFFWEIMMDGITIHVPSVSEWHSFCEKHKASWLQKGALMYFRLLPQKCVSSDI